MSAENRTRPCDRHSSGSVVANTSVVFPIVEFTDNASKSFQSVETCVNPSVVRNNAPVEPKTDLDGMQSIRRHLVDNQISPNVANVIIQSWRPATQKQYSVYINRWTQFCHEREVNPMLPSVNDALEFLHTLYEQDLSYSTLNTAKSALNCYLLTASPHNSSFTVPNHPYINRYMKGVFNCRTPTPRYSERWDVNVVLDFIRTWHPLHNLSLKFITYKLTILLALTSGQRCQTLVALDCQSMTKTEEQFVFHLTEHLKQNRPGSVLSNICARRYRQEELCVYRTIEHYLERTAKLRRSSKLLVSFVKPHDKVTTNTVSRWIKTLLSMSGIDTTKFKAHSTRVASASKAGNSLPTDVILKHVGWASDCVFRKFYDKPVRQDDLFANTVLQ